MSDTPNRLGRLYDGLNWLVRLAGLNVLWLLGVVAGLLIAGVAPATVALFWLLREYQLGRHPRPWTDFWTRWRRALLPTQVSLGIPLASLFVIAFYIVAAANANGAVARGVTVGLVVLAALYVATVIYLPLVINHLDLRPTALWRVTVFAAWRSPAHTLALTAGCTVLIGVAALTMPAALLFFAVSVPAYAATRTGLLVISRALGTT